MGEKEAACALIRGSGLLPSSAGPLGGDDRPAPSVGLTEQALQRIRGAVTEHGDGPEI
jgi:hypothetical protein